MHTTTTTTSLTSAVICQRFDVAGMTCSHCEHAVAAEVGTIPGVVSAVADAAAGTVTVECTREVSRDEVSAAVAEAGYELAR
ncbi:MAG: heavy-metal-associated domain-containing protein [Ilumatobacteraceae bacterium]